MIVEEAFDILKTRHFLNVGTCSDNCPNVAPKLLLKVDRYCIYLIDYVRNATLNNIKQNPKVSISFVNFATLKGYQINGLAQIVCDKCEQGNLLDQYKKKQIELSTERLVRNLSAKKRSDSFEIDFPQEIAIIKVRVDEMVGIDLKGKLEREII